MMYLSVHLKVCEGCGSLWFRAEQGCVYCGRCVQRLKDFPLPSRMRRMRSRGVRKAEKAAVRGGAA